jgi:hypothetical protein
MRIGMKFLDNLKFMFNGGFLCFGKTIKRVAKGTALNWLPFFSESITQLPVFYS